MITAESNKAEETMPSTLEGVNFQFLKTEN